MDKPPVADEPSAHAVLQLLCVAYGFMSMNDSLLDAISPLLESTVMAMLLSNSIPSKLVILLYIYIYIIYITILLCVTCSTCITNNIILHYLLLYVRSQSKFHGVHSTLGIRKSSTRQRRPGQLPTAKLRTSTGRAAT